MELNSYLRAGSRSLLARVARAFGYPDVQAYLDGLPTFVRQALTGEPITVHGDGKQTRCFGFVADAVGAMLQLIQTEACLGQVYNVGTDEEISILGGSRPVEVVRLGYPTLDIPMEAAVIEAIEAVLDRIRPDVIFTHPVDDTHQAHRHTGWASLAAARWYRTVLTYEQLAPRMARGFTPQLYVDVTAWMERKREALRAHASQHRKYGVTWWLEDAEARARLRGHEFGTFYAEAFKVVRMEWRP